MNIQEYWSLKVIVIFVGGAFSLDTSIFEPRQSKNAQLISVFVFVTYIVQYLFHPIPKFQDSCNLLWLYSPVCVGSFDFCSPEDAYTIKEYVWFHNLW